MKKVGWWSLIIIIPSSLPPFRSSSTHVTTNLFTHQAHFHIAHIIAVCLTVSTSPTAGGSLNSRTSPRIGFYLEGFWRHQYHTLPT